MLRSSSVETVCQLLQESPDPWYADGVQLRSYQDAAYATDLYDALNEYQAHWLLNDHSWRAWAPPWPRDALNWWSRRWEYCWAIMQGRPKAGELVLDAGSGITFFPWLLQAMGCDVLCTDHDARLVRPFEMCRKAMGYGPQFVVSSLQHLSLTPKLFDTVCCISVLEHTDNWSVVLQQFARVLRPGGRLVLTCDINLDEPWARNGLAGYTHLLEWLRQDFDFGPVSIPPSMPEGALVTPPEDVQALGNLGIFCVTARRK